MTSPVKSINSICVSQTCKSIEAKKKSLKIGDPAFATWFISINVIEILGFAIIPSIDQ